MPTTTTDRLHPDVSTALVVDDDPFVLQVHEKLLTRAGIGHVFTAASAAEAVDAVLATAGLDVVVTDLEMPEGDGLSLMRTLAQLPKRPALVIVSKSDPRLLRTVEDLASRQGLTVLGTLQKPVSLDAFLRCLGKWRDHDQGGPRQTIEVTAADIARALAEGEFRVYAQPRVKLMDAMPVGVEFLVRWQHPVHGLMGPGTFIAVAEREGLIDALTLWIAERGFAALARWRAAGHAIAASINVSPLSLGHPQFADTLSEVAHKHGIDSDHVIVEITESAVARDAEQALENLARLRLRGFGLAIDDFGTGYASLEQLRNGPFTELKIDRSFVGGAARNPERKALLEASAKMGRDLSLNLVAEGVEGDEDIPPLTAAGIGEAQGFHYARPMPVEDIDDWLNTR